MNIYVVIWTLISAAGLMLSLLLALESFLDLRALAPVGNGRVLHVKARLATELIRGGTHGAFLLIGLQALDAPPGPASLAVVVLIAANAAMIVNSAIAWYVRRHVGGYGLTAAEIEAEAVETALKLRLTAERAAQRLLDLAALTAQTIDPDLRKAVERTADNTEQIAKNTSPE